MPAEFPLHSDFQVYASAARTGTPTATVYDNPAHLGVVALIHCTASAATPSVVFTIQGELGGVYYDILASAAVTGAVDIVMRVYPGLVAVANLAISHPLPRRWRILATHADADSITYNVESCLIK